MEPLLAIVMAVAGAFGSETLNDTARRKICDLWDVARKVIVAKFGTNSRAPQLMDEMQRQPTMSVAEHLAAQLTALNATSDPEIARIFRALAAAANPTNDPIQDMYGPWSTV